MKRILTTSILVTVGLSVYFEAFLVKKDDVALVRPSPAQINLLWKEGSESAPLSKAIARRLRLNRISPKPSSPKGSR